MADACGVEHPGLIGGDNVNVVSAFGDLIPAHHAFGVMQERTHSPARLAGLLEAVSARFAEDAQADADALADSLASNSSAA